MSITVALFAEACRSGGKKYLRKKVDNYKVNVLGTRREPELCEKMVMVFCKAICVARLLRSYISLFCFLQNKPMKNIIDVLLINIFK